MAMLSVITAPTSRVIGFRSIFQSPERLEVVFLATIVEFMKKLEENK